MFNMFDTCLTCLMQQATSSTQFHTKLSNTFIEVFCRICVFRVFLFEKFSHKVQWLRVFVKTRLF